MNMTDTRRLTDSINNQDVNLLGEVIAWNLPENTVIDYQDLLLALRVAGLDEKVAREMLPRYAFSRAAKQLAKERIIRCIEDKAGEMQFQFTREFLNESAGKFQYLYETTLRLDKDTGKISAGDDPGNPGGISNPLVEEAQRLLDKAKSERVTSDITRYIKILFEKNADLFPVRNAGGVYFVPAQHLGFVSKIEKLVEHVNGSVTRFPVPVGTVQGNKSVKEAVQQGLQALIDEHLDAVTEFGADTRESTMTKCFAKIEATKFKIEAYALYLEDQQEKLTASLAAVNLNLRQKVTEVMAAKARA